MSSEHTFSTRRSAELPMPEHPGVDRENRGARQPNERWADLSGAGLTALACAILWVACFKYFEQGFFDDSFITLRYARHLCAGHGLVWNVGERPVEGFTNIAWIALLAAWGRPDNEQLVAIARLLGVLVGMGTLVCAWLATRALLPRVQRSLAGLVPLHLALSPLFCRHALSGMETMMTGLVLAVMVLLWCAVDRRQATPGYWIALGALTFLAFLTRPDALLFAVSGTAALLFRRSAAGRVMVRGAIPYGLSAAGLLAAFLAWKYCYFGSLIPLPAYMKARPDRIWVKPDLVRFVVHHWFGFLAVIAPLLLICGLAWASGRIPRLDAVRCIALASTVYGVYFLGVLPVMSIDWRYLFPLYAPLAILAAGCLATLTGAPGPHAAGGQRLGRLALLLLFAGYNVGNFHDLRHVARAVYQDHVKYGLIGRELAAFPGLSVAVSEVGQLSYQADCRILDLAGLNDTFIARHRFRDSDFTAHFGQYLRQGFGLPDVYVDPPAEYAYAYLSQHPGIAREYIPVKVWELQVYVLQRSRYREPLLARLRALARKPPPPALPLTG